MMSEVHEEARPLIPLRPGDGPAPATPAGGSSFMGSLINLTNTIVGAGLLSIPFAFRVAGLVPALLCLLLVWALSTLSFDVLARSASYSHTFTYKEIAVATTGVLTGFVAELCIVVYTFLNLIGRGILLVQLLTPALEQFGAPAVLRERWLIVLVGAALVFPFTILRRIDGLKVTSFFSLACVLLTTGTVVYMFDATHIPSWDHVMVWPSSVDGLIAFGILIVSFCAHYNMPTMYRELRQRSPRRMRWVILISTSFCALLYTVVGTLGYLTCLDHTQGNVLEDYAANAVPVSVARVALVLAIVLSTPLVLYACRRSFLTLFLARFQHADTHEYPLPLWIGVALLIQLLSGVVAYLFNEIEVVFGFSGAVIGSTFVFFIPGLIFVRLSRQVSPTSVGTLSLNHEDSTLAQAPSRTVLAATGWLLMVAAVVLGVLGTVGSALRVIDAGNATATNATLNCWGQ